MLLHKNSVLLVLFVLFFAFKKPNTLKKKKHTYTGITFFKATIFGQFQYFLFGELVFIFDKCLQSFFFNLSKTIDYFKIN